MSKSGNDLKLTRVIAIAIVILFPFWYFPKRMIRKHGWVNGSLIVFVLFYGIFVWSEVDTTRNELFSGKSHERFDVRKNQEATIDRLWDEMQRNIMEDTGFSLFTANHYQTVYHYSIIFEENADPASTMMEERAEEYGRYVAAYKKYEPEFKQAIRRLKEQNGLDDPRSAIENNLRAWDQAMNAHWGKILLYWAAFLLTVFFLLFKPLPAKSAS